MSGRSTDTSGGKQASKHICTYHILYLYIHDVLVHARLFAWMYTCMSSCGIMWYLGMVIHLMGFFIINIEIPSNGLMNIPKWF